MCLDLSSIKSPMACLYTYIHICIHIYIQVPIYLCTHMYTFLYISSDLMYYKHVSTHIRAHRFGCGCVCMGLNLVSPESPLECLHTYVFIHTHIIYKFRSYM